MENKTMEKIIAKYLDKTILQKNADNDSKSEAGIKGTFDTTTKIRATDDDGYAKEPATSDADPRSKALGYKITNRGLWKRIITGDILDDKQ